MMSIQTKYLNYIDLVYFIKISYPLLLVACCPIEGLLQQSPKPVSSILSFHENEPQFWFETYILLLFPSWFASSGSWFDTKVCCWLSSKYAFKTGSCFSDSWWLHCLYLPKNRIIFQFIIGYWVLGLDRIHWFMYW